MNDEQQNTAFSVPDPKPGDATVPNPPPEGGNQVTNTLAQEGQAPQPVAPIDMSDVSFDIPMKDPVNIVNDFPNEEPTEPSSVDFSTPGAVSDVIAPNLNAIESQVPVEIQSPGGALDPNLSQEKTAGAPSEDAATPVEVDEPFGVESQVPEPVDEVEPKPSDAAQSEVLDQEHEAEYKRMLEEHLEAAKESAPDMPEPEIVPDEQVEAEAPQADIEPTPEVKEADFVETESVEDALRSAVEARVEVEEAKKRAEEEVKEAREEAKSRAEEVVGLIDDAIKEASEVIKKKESDLESLISIQKNEISELHKRVTALRKKRTEMRRYLGLTEKDK